jgi:hypothetical protein
MTKRAPRPIRIPVPGLNRTVGLGQAIKKLTSSVGVSACGGCQRRAAQLDRRITFTSLRHKP